MLVACATAAEGMTTVSEGLTNTAAMTGAIWLKLIPNIWNKFARRKRSRLSRAPMPTPEISAIGKRQAIHGSARATSGFNSTGTESIFLSKYPPTTKSNAAPKRPEADIENHRRQQHAGALRLRSVAKFRQSVGCGPRKSKVKKTEIAEENPYDRYHAIARVPHMAYVDRNGHQSDCQADDRIDQVKSKISPEWRFRHAYLSTRKKLYFLEFAAIETGSTPLRPASPFQMRRR